MRKRSTRGKKRGKTDLHFPAMSKSSSRKHGRSRPLMRPWLEDLLDNEMCLGLKWVNKSKKIFSIVWRHASSTGFNVTEHSDVFYRWAFHTAKPGRSICEDHTANKTNFRCALNSLKDCIQLTKPSDKRGVNAKRTYQFIEKDHPNYDIKRKRRQQKKNKMQEQEEFGEHNFELNDPLTDLCEAEQNTSNWGYPRNEVVSPALDASSSSPPAAELIENTHLPIPACAFSNISRIQGSSKFILNLSEGILAGSPDNLMLFPKFHDLLEPSFSKLIKDEVEEVQLPGSDEDIQVVPATNQVCSYDHSFTEDLTQLKLLDTAADNNGENDDNFSNYIDVELIGSDENENFSFDLDSMETTLDQE